MKKQCIWILALDPEEIKGKSIRLTKADRAMTRAIKPKKVS